MLSRSSLRLASCVAIAALLPSVAFARIYIADQTRNQVNIYPSTATGNTAPTVTIIGANTGLSQPCSVAVDANYIYVANYEGAQGNSVTVYPLNASGNASPVATITGATTGIDNCIGVAVDANYLYVVSESSTNNILGSISVFPKTANGNVAPLRVIGFPTGDEVDPDNTGLAYPFCVAVDANYIYVSNPDGGLGNGTVCVFPLGASGNVVPSFTLSGVGNGIHDPVALAVDANNLYVTNDSAEQVAVFALAGLNSNSVATAIISGSNTAVSVPIGIAVDATRMYVRNSGAEAITTFPLTANGNVAPSTTLGGISSNSLITTGFGLAEDSSSFTHFVVNAPPSATAGTPFNVVVTATDDNGNTVTGYSGTVQFTSTDGSAVLPANSTLTNGTGTFSVTLNSDLNQTVTATDTVSSIITGTSGTIAVAGVVTHFSVGLNSPTNAGFNNTVTVTALNASNATVHSYSGIVHLTSTDSNAVISANSTLTNGTGTFTVTFHTSGTQTVTAADTVASALTGTSALIVVTSSFATHLSVSAPPTATAGTPVNVVVTALDFYNNVATSYTGSVRFTSTDGSAALPVISSLTLGTGTFPVTFGTAGAQTVTATDTITATITGTSAPVTVSAAPPTHFSVSAPGAATAGTPFNVTVTALSASNALVSSYAGTIHFTSTDPNAVLPADVVLGGGSGNFAVTLRTSGAQHVTVTDAITPSITGFSGVIAVSAGAATHLLVAAPGTANPGTPFNITLTAIDAFNNPATTYGGTVHFTSTDVGAVLPANSTLIAGVGTVAVTLETPGAQTVTATDVVSPSITGLSGAITVSALPATHITVSAPATATVGVPFNVTITALTASNTTATSYAGTVHFTSSDGSAILPVNMSLVLGTATIPVTLQTAGTQSVTVTDTVTNSITGTSAAITVSAAPATHFTVSAPGAATAGTPFNVTVTALNAANTTVTGYAGTVHFTSSDGSAALPANGNLINGVGTFAVTLQTAGGQTVTATDAVTNSITGISGTITVSAPAATHFTVTAPATASPGTPFNVTVTARTAANATATGYAGTVHFTSSDGGATLPANATLTNGTGTFAVTLQTIGTQTVTATDAVTTSITGVSGSIALAGPATHFSVSAPATAAPGTPISVTVTALSAANVTATGYAGTVHFTSSDGSATLPGNGTLINGVGTFAVTLQTTGSQTVTATDTVTNSITGASGAIAVSSPVATHFTVSAPAAATQGSPVNAIVTALTAANAPATTYAGTVHLSSSDGAATLPANGVLINGTGTFAVTLNTAGTQTVTATDTLTASITGVSGPIAVAASPAMVGLTALGGGAAVARGGLAPDATGQTSTLGAYINAGGTGGTLVGYLASLSAGFTANFTLASGQFTTTTTTLTGGTSLGQTLTLSGTLTGGVLSGTIAPLGVPFSVTLDSLTGSSAAVSGLYAASGSTSGSAIYSIVGTQGELFVLDVSPGLVSAGVGTVNPNDTFTVTTSQGTTISGSVNAGTTAITGTATPATGSPVVFSGEGSGASPTVAPAAQSVTAGATATLTVSTSAASPTYQWLFNGVPVAGAAGATLTLPNIGTTQAGDYAAVVTSGGTSVVSNSATVTVTYSAWLANLSTRAYVAPTLNSADVLIAGFVTVGPGGKQLLVRGVGPGLQQFSVPGFLPNPSLTIFSGSAGGPVLTSWSPSLAGQFASLGAFPLPAGSADAATVNAYGAGPYTAIVSPADGKQSGIALVEVYDADHGAPASRLANISGRAYVSTGSNILIGGFVINGSTSETVLIRAVGPALGAAPFSVPGTLAQPILQVYDANPSGGAAGPKIIAQIQGWGGAPAPGPSGVAAGIQPASAAAMSAVGAFSLPAGSADSALILTLPPGAYTAEVSGANGGSGIALVEIYEVP